MWVEELGLENIRCFEKNTIKLGHPGRKSNWVTFLSENGAGKSTALQALGLMLAGPEGAQQLLPRPVGWVRNESQPGKISIRIHKGENDPGQFGEQRIHTSFGYTYYLTGRQPITIRNQTFTEPTILANRERRLTWLRQNAFISKGPGWFAVGYGAFRRLTRSTQIMVPSLESQARFSNFVTQFDEDQPLSAFERWMVYLDYRIAKVQDEKARRQRDLGVSAINKVLPQNVRFDSVSSEGRIIFDMDGQKVPTIGLSDGYRSVLGLAGDLVWRLIQAFPNSRDPLSEEGVVLIDELDIHLHPIWQRDIAIWLKEQFPNLQFIVATHSPLVAAGAGPNASTLRFHLHEGRTVVDKVTDIASMNVDRILQSEAFGLISPYSPQTQEKIDRYDALLQKRKRTREEDEELQLVLEFVKTTRPIGGPPQPDSLDARIEKYLEKVLND